MELLVCLQLLEGIKSMAQIVSYANHFNANTEMVFISNINFHMICIANRKVFERNVRFCTRKPLIGK